MFKSKKLKEKSESPKEIIFFKKYRLIKKLGDGAFGSVYLTYNMETGEDFAIKVEKRRIPHPLLEKEAYILFYLKGPGLPEVKSFGKTKDYNVLIQTLLGKSLYDLYNDFQKRFTIKDICMIGIQTIERLEYIHSKGYIHRDIKPHNFLIGNKNPGIIYIIDFGLSKKFRSEKGKHVRFSISRNITGTPRYCSVNALRGVEQSRRDDLESLCYVLLYFFKGKLPWQGLKISNRTERFIKINEIKREFKAEMACKGLPKEYEDFYRYVKNLEFEEHPDYYFMKNCFKLIILKMNTTNDGMFSWLNRSSLPMNKIMLPINLSQRKQSPQKRLYENIMKSLEDKKESSILESPKGKYVNPLLISDDVDQMKLNTFDHEKNFEQVMTGIKNENKKIFIHGKLIFESSRNSTGNNISNRNNILSEDTEYKNTESITLIAQNSVIPPEEIIRNNNKGILDFKKIDIGRIKKADLESKNDNDRDRNNNKNIIRKKIIFKGFPDHMRDSNSWNKNSLNFNLRKRNDLHILENSITNSTSKNIKNTNPFLVTEKDKFTNRKKTTKNERNNCINTNGSGNFTYLTTASSKKNKRFALLMSNLESEKILGINLPNKENKKENLYNTLEPKKLFEKKESTAKIGGGQNNNSNKKNKKTFGGNKDSVNKGKFFQRSNNNYDEEIRKGIIKTANINL